MGRKLLAGRQPAGDHPDAVAKQRRIRRMMNVGLNGGRVDPDLLPRFDLLVLGVVDDLAVDRLPRLFRQGLDVLLEDRLAGILTHLQAGEAAEGR